MKMRDSSSLPTPPRILEWLLKHVMTTEDLETISGDLLEEYREVKVAALGVSGANGWFAMEVAGFYWRLVWPCLLMLALYWTFGVIASNLYSNGDYGIPHFINNMILVVPMFGLWVGQHAGTRSQRAASGAIVAVLAAFVISVMAAAS